MFSIVKSILKRIFGKPPTHDVQETPQEKTAFSIGHDWPFPSPEPPNAEYLVGELIKGVQVEGDHVFFFWDGQKRRHIRTSRSTETILARNVIWWMEGRKVPSMANGLTTNCGEVKCIKLSHLILRMPQIPLNPVALPGQQHTAKKHTTQGISPAKPEKVEHGDRNRCITRKVYFPSRRKATEKARILNSPEVRGHGRRVYVYPCDMLCGGFHLTKISSKAWDKGAKKKAGSW